MEDVKCRKLVATYQDEKLILEGPKFLKFQVDENVLVEIEQLGTRIITIIFVEEDSFRELYGILTKVERLLMIIDGRFIPCDNGGCCCRARGVTYDDNRGPFCEYEAYARR